MVESLLEILTKRRNQLFLQASRCPLCGKYGKYGKYDFSCGPVVNNLKEKQLFSDQMIREIILI